MVSTISVFTYALLVVGAVARPSQPKLDNALVGRLPHLTAPKRPGRTTVAKQNVTEDATQDVITANWAGAVLSAGAGTYQSVTATFTVPVPQFSTDGGSDVQAASVWVGIDGDTCQTAILQTGINLLVDNQGDIGYQAWYEWFPAASIAFPDISFNPGDQVKLTVTASSTTTGTATVENVSNGQVATQEVSSDAPLCMQDAEWIVEDFESGGGLVPFANFGTVTFDGVVASGPGGSVNAAGATSNEIEQNESDGILTSVSNAGSSITVSYIGQ